MLLSAQPSRILIPRFDTLGDIVLLEGFLEAFLHRFPKAQTTLLTRRVYADLACLFPDTLSWQTTDIDPHKQSPDKFLIAQLLEDLGSPPPDLVLVTAHNRTWADNVAAAKMAGAKSYAIGHWNPMPAAHAEVFEELGLRAECPYECSIPVSENSHEIEKYQVLWQALTGEPTLPEPKLYVSEHLRTAAETILHSAGLQYKNFCLCFPAGVQKVAIKTWPQDRFAEIIAWLELERGLPSLIAGHRSEAVRVEEVGRLARERGARPKIWLGRDGEIPIVAALLQAARLYLGNDTGPMHMAAAVNTPVVATFGGGTWPRFIPRGNSSIAVGGDMPCFGCGWDCIFGDAPCIPLITVADVKQAVDDLLGGAVISGPRVSRASTKLSRETSEYIEKAIKTHRGIDEDRLARLEANLRLEKLLKESEADRAARLAEIERVGQQLAASGADRAARLVEMEQIGKRLEESEADRAARLAEIERVGQQLAASEADRAVRLAEMEQLGKRLQESEADRAARLTEMGRLGQQLAASEADRVARLAEMERLGKRLDESEADRATLREAISRLKSQLQVFHNQLEVLQSVRNNVLVRGLIKSGLVKEKDVSNEQKSDA